MKISEIKTRTEEKHPFFFTRKTLRFFGQTMAMFKVSKCTDGRFLITCPGQWTKGSPAIPFGISTPLPIILISIEIEIFPY